MSASPERSYRLGWSLWIACSLAEAAAFVAIAGPATHPGAAVRLAALLPIQAVIVPALLWQARYASPTEAAARSAVCGLASGALLMESVRLFEPWFHDRQWTDLDLDALQPSY